MLDGNFFQTLWHALKCTRGLMLGSVLLMSTSLALAGGHKDGEHSHEGEEGAETHHASSPRFKVTEIQSGFYLLQGRGGNILASIGEDGTLLVDAGYADMTSALSKTLKELGGELQYVINTHWHGDHTQGNHMLGTKADIVAHENVRDRLTKRQEIKLFNMVSEPYGKQALPDITYDSTLNLYFNGDKIELVHAPVAHTDGDSVVFFEQANIVHLGDLFFNGFYPFVDVGSGGSVRGVARNIEGLLESIPRGMTIVPGHGPIAGKDELIAFHDMLIGTSEEVEAMMADGKSLDQIKQAGLSDKWDSWGGGFLNEETWIGIVHSSSSQSN